MEEVPVPSVVSPPSSPQHNSQEQSINSDDNNDLKSVTIYRTRSGRKATGKITTSPSKKSKLDVTPSTSASKLQPVSKIIHEAPISEKVLRVSLFKIDRKSGFVLTPRGRPNHRWWSTPPKILEQVHYFSFSSDSDSDSVSSGSVQVKTQQNSNADDAESGDEYFTFPSAKPEGEDPLATKDDGKEGGDSDWNPSASDDEDDDEVPLVKRIEKQKASGEDNDDVPLVKRMHKRKAKGALSQKAKRGR